MLVLGLLGWMIGGYIVFYISLAIHVFKAEYNGYEALRYLKECVSPLGDDILHSANGIVRVILGLMIWPVQWIRFLTNIPNLYDEYELKP